MEEPKRKGHPNEMHKPGSAHPEGETSTRERTVNKRISSNASLLIWFPVLFGWAMLTYALLKYIVVDVHGEGGHDFRYFYLVASMLRDGIDYTSLPPERFTELARHYLGNASYPADAPYVVYHAPTLFIAFIPLTYLSPAHAAAMWGVISFMLYMGGVALLIRTVMEHVSWSSHERPLFLAAAWFVASVYYPFQSGLRLGQLDVLLFFFCVASYWAICNNSVFLSGLFGAMLCCIKPASLLLLPFWMFHKKSLASVMLVGVLGVGLTVAVLDMTFLLNYMEKVIATGNRFFDHVVLWHGNISLLAFIGRLLHMRSDQFPVLKLLSQGMGVVDIIFISILGRLAINGKSGKQESILYFPLAISIWLIALPQIELFYLVTGIIPIMVALFMVNQISRTAAFLVIASAVTVAFPYSVERFTIFQTGPLSLIKSAKVFALVVIAWILWSLAKRGNDRAAAEPGTGQPDMKV